LCLKAIDPRWDTQIEQSPDGKLLAFLNAPESQAANTISRSCCLPRMAQRPRGRLMPTSFLRQGDEGIESMSL
jgi:hypothetical protein